MRLQDGQQVEREKAELQFDPQWATALDAVALLTFQTEREFVRRALRWIEEHGFPSDA